MHAWSRSSPMIVREGHKICRICALYLYCRTPPQGADKMSNRSSGIPCTHIDDQCNTVVKKRTNEEEKETHDIRSH